MSLGNPVQIRLHSEKQKALEIQAARKGKALATYLREIVEGNDLHAELTTMRMDLAALRNSAEANVAQNEKDHEVSENAILLEVLLLLRSIAGPDRMSIVDGEMRRIGFEIWKPKD